MCCDRPRLIRIAACLATSGLWLNSGLPSALAQQYVPPDLGLPERLGDGGTRLGNFGRPPGADAPAIDLPQLEQQRSPAQPAPGRYVPPASGLPGRREAGGTRSGSCINNSQPENLQSNDPQNLVALMPPDNYGGTVMPYPTLFWQVPSNQAAAIELILFDEADNEIYRTQLQITGEAGIVSLTLPAHAGMLPLEVGELYRWSFSLICDSGDRSADVYTEGWIQRVEPAPDLVAQLEAAAESDRPAIYAAAGLWHDALTAIAEQRRADPEDAAANARWRNLLESVGLDAVADEPLDHAD
jgi:hypothetical protein